MVLPHISHNIEHYSGFGYCPLSKNVKMSATFQGHDKWVPIATACGVLRVQMEEWPSVLRVAVNILN
jgi:hypothetical protein